MFFTETIHDSLNHEQRSNPQSYTQDGYNRKGRKTLSWLKELAKGDLKEPEQVKFLGVFIWSQSREENHITNISSPSEKNDQAINSNTQAACGRHTMLER